MSMYASWKLNDANRMITSILIPKWLNKSQEKSWLNRTLNMINTPKIKAFGQVEACQRNSIRQGKAKQAQTRHNFIHQLHTSLKQNPNMVNA
jgi:hypothetical protein